MSLNGFRRGMRDGPAKATLLLFGVGELGYRLLEILARMPNHGWRIVAASRTADHALRRVNAALLSASYAEHFPDIVFAPVDIHDATATRDLIARERPSAVVNTASRSPWWVRALLPAHIRARLERVGAGPGLWAPGHLAMTRTVLMAMAEVGCSAPVINAAYPDVVNPALAHLAPGPILGIGNIDLLVPPIRYLVGSDLKVSPRNVAPFLVAHNFHSSRILAGLDLNGLSGGAPFLKVLVDGTDVTDRLDVAALLQRIPREVPIPIGAGSGALAVGSLCRTVLAVMADTFVTCHAPGPEGLPGGYPVEIDRNGARVVLPADISLERALAINQAGQRAEGIETIEFNGSLRLTETAREVLSDVFGITAASISPEDAGAFAGELDERFRELASRYGIHPPELRRSA